MNASPRGALRLRELALRTLAGLPADAAWQPAAACSAAIWRAFLRAERCAIRLERALETTGYLQQLSPEVRDVIRQRALDEQTRILSARSQLHELGQIAVERDWRPAVLKGGLSALVGPGPVDLNDVDILVPKAAAGALATVLDDRGHGAIFSTAQHLGARILPNALPVEIHISLEADGALPAERVWQGLTPVPGCPGLHALAPADHLWHVLRHAVVDHPNRRGRLRDLLVVSDAVAACGPEELAQLESRVDQHEYTTPLRDVLAMAAAMSTSTPLTDRFRQLALAHYLVRQVTGRLPVSTARARDLAEWTFALLLGRRERRALWIHQVWQRTLEPSPYRFIAWLEQRFPRLGRAWRVSIRSAYRALLVAGAVPIACAVKVICARSLPATPTPERG
jgi:hypothetical protein